MTLLTRTAILALLVEWHAQHEAIESVVDALREIAGCEPESPLMRALWGTFDRYSDQLEARILGSAECQWLGYYQLEADMGARAMQVESGPITYTLNGIEALADMLAAFAAEAKTARESAPSAP